MAEVNSCYNALDVHVENGRAEQPALIYDSPVTDTVRKYTYRELRDEVAQLAGVLVGMGVEKGDRVIIYMPMVPEAAMAMLACARIGAIHSVVFGGFAANELATRIDDAKPKVIVSASCGIEPTRLVPYKPLLDQAIRSRRTSRNTASSCSGRSWRRRCMPGRDVDWAEVRGRGRSRSTACPSPPPTRSISSTPPAPPACPRAWCATTAAIWSR